MEPELLRRALLYSLALLKREQCSYILIACTLSRCFSRQVLYILFQLCIRQYLGSTWQSPGSIWTFLQCVELGFFNLVSRALNDGANVHYFQERALRIAAGNGHDTIVSLLLERGANLHIRGDKPLYQAAYYGHKSTVQLLLDHGADVHAGDECALRWAVLRRHYDIANMLIERGAHIPTALRWCRFSEEAISWLEHKH